MTHSPQEKRQGQHPDRAISNKDEDRYGFTHIATELARAIKEIGREGSAVIGIEGAWGTGKTSLLNLLRTALEKQQEARTFVLNISPWLDGSDTPLVASLLLPVAAIIAEEEERRLSAKERTALKRKKALTGTAQTLMDYTRATARNLAPVAQIAAVIPCVPNASGALNAVAESSWLKEKEKTTADMRTEIARKIEELDLSFIVLLDDLDRLEPAQAVEVIRLVKSVADFPRFRYLLCYDKAVLSQAISQGLGVADGSLYLQKIIQIAFALPRPESFALRQQFHDAAIELYQTVNDFPPEKGIQADLTAVANIYGATLKTPREVQTVLNALRFRYAGMRDYVYFPDLCFLQLLRTTNSGLYDWVEEYLSERNVVQAEDGQVSDEEQKALVGSLDHHLKRYFPAAAHSAWELREWVPGINGGLGKLPVTLFERTGPEESAQLTAEKRLGSQAYWRYYFAFSSPQNILSPQDFEQLFALAGQYNQPEKQQELAECLLGYIQSKNLSSRTWFEHILAQLTSPLIKTRMPAECRGLLGFFFDNGDEMLRRYQARNAWLSLHDLDTYSVADRLIQRILREDAVATMKFLTVRLQRGKAWYWSAEYVRHLLWQHGIAGDRMTHQQEQWMDLGNLAILRDTLATRLNSPAITEQLPTIDQLSRYFFVWRDISGIQAVREWVKNQIQGDEAFLNLLLQLRYHGISTAIGQYRALDLAEMVDFLGDAQTVQARIDRIKQADHFPEQIEEVNQSIKRAANRRRI
ncbi:KAP family P-loop NTPase fold protein [Serratia marcescens]|uniref:KAP family P-loop NTPase fold protein n=1 Tax=Serratia TaxID=613 RepID=UPI0014614412|nr:P-loop NTPase fold protein [Serratia marcescens]MBH3189382.1 NTPase [Serratia marcescens]NMQ37680.1 NTPase [Serratia marcescens]